MLNEERNDSIISVKNGSYAFLRNVITIHKTTVGDIKNTWIIMFFIGSGAYPASFPSGKGVLSSGVK
jgi:hypothetical protein